MYATYHLYYSTGTRLLVGAQVLRCDCVATLVRSLFLFPPACALVRLEALAVDYGAKKWSEREGKGGEGRGDEAGEAGWGGEKKKEGRYVLECV